VAEIRLRRRL